MGRCERIAIYANWSEAEWLGTTGELRAIHLNSSVVDHEISILSMSLTG